MLPSYCWPPVTAGLLSRRSLAWSTKLFVGGENGKNDIRSSVSQAGEGRNGLAPASLPRCSESQALSCLQAKRAPAPHTLSGTERNKPKNPSALRLDFLWNSQGQNEWLQRRNDGQWFASVLFNRYSRRLEAHDRTELVRKDTTWVMWRTRQLTVLPPPSKCRMLLLLLL